VHGMNESKTLAEALPIEQARVRELMQLYKDPILGGAGAFAVALMDQSLQNAEKVIMAGDTVGMLRAYEDLKSYQE